MLPLALLSMLSPSVAWSNGYSAQEASNFAKQANLWNRASMYGTHDYLAEYALSFLPEEEKAWIRNVSFFYGTELPDSTGNSESIGDRNAQYLKFGSRGNAISDLMANRSMLKYDVAVAALSHGEDGTASKAAGTILAYIENSGLFSRVIEGSEKGLSFEAYIGTLSNAPYPQERFESLFGQYISFDGSLEMISPYDAVMRVGQATYLGKKDGSCSAQWMEKSYDIGSEEFLSCAGRDFNNIINAEADALHTIYKAAHGAEYTIYAADWASYAEAQTGTPLPPPPQQANLTNATVPAAGNADNPPAKTGGNSGSGSGVPPASKAAPNDSGIAYLIAALVIAAIAAFAAMRMLKRAPKAKKSQKQPPKQPPKQQ